MNDNGQDNLTHDIGLLLEDSQMYMFHDFHENGLITPKVALVQRLEKLITNVKEGRYDN